MRSLTVPVSLSNLLLPTVPADLSGSFFSLSLLMLDGCGSGKLGAGCWDSGCCGCANTGGAPTQSPAKRKIARMHEIPLCLVMAIAKLSPERTMSWPKKGSHGFQNMGSQ